ncbi:leucine-rich repeats and immunoglobulin-like domains protein 2 [Daktulosphaira vitifoliae]|uniref:leucine-rich repeats and immunoglobulin-like domains protein 2 n=1 Tax=Daktulosphaira vitifoliae TaxID=58002 RepID=UPI0021AADC32|nr:leucine-rich repeats and immunoglobulin-like domains protein 2 [Daktulosphaira vitifoliae]XP_050536583.1 leucine-rich repeats and immunoglobulin-like domains protein 2 [Daktulosphaira vitifoliae]XP_050536584.1 leucine-rich repeats and immunoglobulin-like domains protein 2 [Daktulosphaira vitifoliae]XP_050536585.1 leucine-rich repeats and immunoglobulin-like domains protein 2 [Daktulosphaira vitifoliae]
MISRLILVCGLISAIAVHLTWSASGPVVQQCPTHGEISPCVCTVKKNGGLDILCEFTDLQHISKTMAVLKGKPSLVIFYLKLRHNNLPKLQGFVFLGMDIRHLTIHNSTLAVVEESSLSSIGKALTQLDLSQNSLSSVPTPALKSLDRLLIFNLNHNKISAIHTNAFEGMSTLEILTLYENRLTNIEPNAFAGTEKKLKRLNIGGNELNRVPTDALQTMDNLKKLEMQENKITSINEGDFIGLKTLDMLILAHNFIKHIPAKVFRHLPLLNSLELDGNQISHIDEEAFYGLEENLQYLRLGDNNLHMIPSDSLRRLHRLRHLDLKANNISFIADDAFTGFGDSITFLNLQKNDIKTLPTMSFENLNSLEILNLQNNKLTHVPEETLEAIVDTATVIDLMDNPLICDCDLRWYKDWLLELKLRDDDEIIQKKHILCYMEAEHREYSITNMPLKECAGKENSSSKGSGMTIESCRILIFIVLAILRLK